MTTKTNTAFIDHPSEWNITGTVTPLGLFTEAESLLISHSMSTIFDKKPGVRVTNTTESSFSIKTKTQNAEFSVVTQVHQTGGHGNPQYESGRWSESDNSPEWVTQNEQTRTAEQHLLVSDTWKSWRNWGSNLNTNTIPQRVARTEREGETKLHGWHKILNIIT